MSAKPFVLYQNVLADAETITADYEEGDFFVNNLKDGIFWSFYRTDTLGAEIVVVLASGIEVDTIGFSANQLADLTGTVEIEGWTGFSWVPVLSTTSINVMTKVITFGAVTHDQYRITIVTTGKSYIGAMYLGKRVEFPRALDGSVAPPEFDTRYLMSENMSETGNMISFSRIKTPVKFKIDQRDVDPDFIGTTWYDFINVARANPFFWVWNPQYLPDVACFAELEKRVGAASYSTIFEAAVVVGAKGII